MKSRENWSTVLPECHVPGYEWYRTVQPYVICHVMNYCRMRYMSCDGLVCIIVLLKLIFIIKKNVVLSTVLSQY